MTFRFNNNNNNNNDICCVTCVLSESDRCYRGCREC